MPRRILILSASVGAGHIRAAEAVELTIRGLDPQAHVVNVDVLDHATAAFRRIYGRAYLDLVNKAPHFLGWFYDFTDRPPSPRSKRDQLRMLVQRANMPRFSRLLLEGEGTSEEKKPRPGGTSGLPSKAEPPRKSESSGKARPPWDAVVCTHFLPAEIISLLRRKGRWPMRSAASLDGSRTRRAMIDPAAPPVHTVVTDFDAHGLWVNLPCDEADRYFAATDEASITLRRWGVPGDRITITGIPVHPVFAQPRDRDEMRRKHDLSLDRPVVLLLAGGFGVGPIEALFESALEASPGGGSAGSPRGIHLCAVCGKNEALRKKLQAVKVPSPHRATVIGFTREMDELMAAADIVISKPGGLTTSEILARGGAMAIVNPIPGQESRNSDFLLENGAAVKINSAAILPHKLERLLNDSARLASLRTAARNLGRPRAAFDIAEAVLSPGT